jgi:ABC-type transporter Mla MlaB component
VGSSTEADGLREPPVAAVERVGDAVVVRLTGELDLYNAHEVRNALVEQAAGEPERVVVDLSGVEFIDSTALGVLIEARTKLANRRRVPARRTCGRDTPCARDLRARPALRPARLGRRRARRGALATRGRSEARDDRERAGWQPASRARGRAGARRLRRPRRAGAPPPGGRDDHPERERPDRRAGGSIDVYASSPVARNAAATSGAHESIFPVSSSAPA